MKFVSAIQKPNDNKTAQGVCFLSYDNWDDFGFKLTFAATLFDYDGIRHDLGLLKILTKGIPYGRVHIGDAFDELNAEFCSLGNDREYYIKLSRLRANIRDEYLKGIRDCAFNPSIWQEFKSEKAMVNSLLRSVSVRDVTKIFPRILGGYAELTPYAFSYHFATGVGDISGQCDFRVEPRSLPPSNVHVIIGRNGVGKTRLLAGMVDALTEGSSAPMGLHGHFVFEDRESDEDTDFLNLVVVSYSAFDRFDPIMENNERSKRSIPYNYVGIKKRESAVGGQIALKTIDDVNLEFETAVRSMLQDGTRMERLRKAIEILNSDPGIRDLNLSRILDSANDITMVQEVSQQFVTLSSGHKIVLLSIVKLVEFVSDRSLVLIDEPETHLHPPLLGSFIRAVSELLVARNGVAILATHSPVVLQEVPTDCVSIMRRSGDVIRVARPETETFAENVGVLTRKVFGLEVNASGFFKLISDIARDRDFAGTLEEFGGKLGGEGRALARALTSKDDLQ